MLSVTYLDTLRIAHVECHHNCLQQKHHFCNAGNILKLKNDDKNYSKLIIVIVDGKIKQPMGKFVTCKVTHLNCFSVTKLQNALKIWNLKIKDKEAYKRTVHIFI